MTTKTISKKAIVSKLNSIAKDGETSELTKAVITSILYHSDGYDTPIGYMSDVLNHGCQSGMVGELIYNTDTKKFFHDHSEDILEVAATLSEELGENIGPKKENSPYSNWYAWFGYEETVRNLMNEINPEW